MDEKEQLLEDRMTQLKIKTGRLQEELRNTIRDLNTLDLELRLYRQKKKATEKRGTPS